MQDEEKSGLICNVDLKLGVNICDSLSLPLVAGDTLSSSSSSSSSLSPHFVAPPVDLSPPDSGRSSMGDSLVNGLATLLTTSLSPSVWEASSPASPSSRYASAPMSPSNYATAPISPFSSNGATWSVAPPRKTNPPFANVWNSSPAPAAVNNSAAFPGWGGTRFRRSTSYPGRNNIFGSVTNHLTVAPPALEITNADEANPYIYQDQYAVAANGLDNNFRSLDCFLQDVIPQENELYHGNNYYGLDAALDPGYGDDVTSALHFSNFGLNTALALQDGFGLNLLQPSGCSPSRLSPRSPLLLNGSSSSGPESMERYSRKVFVGGLPPDIDEEEINASFRRFGSLVVDWPHKAESKSYFPPKGYAFLLFQEEISVQKLIEACIAEDDKLYLYVSSPTIKDKAVQIRPWKLSDADFVLDASLPLDPRKTVFVGGVPRPLKAVELALIMDRLYGGVCYAGIDIDPELKYPKGAGRVAFSNQQSYIAAISARFVQLQHVDIDKRVEVKPYVLDDQFCDECQGTHSAGRFAPFFCANITCLQYYCESCWALVHSQPGREFHKPLVKEGADRPRTVHFRW